LQWVLGAAGDIGDIGDIGSVGRLDPPALAGLGENFDWPRLGLWGKIVPA
jgi:hypothetical protein